MALLQKTKVAVFECRPYAVKNALTGEEFKGFTVKAYKPDGSVVAFTSPTVVQEHDLGGYDENVAAEVTLYGRGYKDQIKWSTDKKAPSVK